MCQFSNANNKKVPTRDMPSGFLVDIVAYYRKQIHSSMIMMNHAGILAMPLACEFHEHNLAEGEIRCELHQQ